MKRAGHLIEQVADTDNLLLAFYKAQRGKQGKAEVVRYREHLDKRISELQHQLLSDTVRVGEYRTFYVYDPKKRLICAAAFGERVLHHALMNVCHPFFERHLISSTYATRIGKGTYKALEHAHHAMSRYRYVAKLDVRKYFDTVDHAVLKLQLRRIFKDKALLTVFDAIIDSYQTEECHGLPIGNLTSQYFANHYLSCCDHYIKETLRVPEYVRYMDDMLLFADDYYVLQHCVNEVISYVDKNLHLRLKPPVLVSTAVGVPFLGYHLKKFRIVLTGRSRRRFAQRLCLYGKLLDKEVWTEKQYYEHIAPLLAFTSHAYAKRWRRRVVESRRAPTA